MRILIIVFVWATSIEWSIAYKNEKSAKDLEIALNECMKRGREIENNFQNCEKFDLDAYENIPSAYFDLCRASFHVACFEALEEFECSRGKTVAAQKGEKCDGNETDTFKKCCNACKFGAELKATTGSCEIRLRLSSDELRNVTKRCCEEDFSDLDEEFGNFDDRDDVELEAVEEPVPEALIAPAETIFSCLDYHCQDNEECSVTFYGPSCFCKPGFLNTDSDKCRDINECALGLDDCSKDHKQCHNTPGSFECGECLDGYTKTKNYFEDDGDDLCIDSNECLDNVCRENEICTNMDGSYRCTNVSCPSGYVQYNSTDCKLKTCQSKVCHKTFSFHFKSVSARDKTNEVFRFPKTHYEATLDTDFFEIVAKGRDFVVMQIKPLPHDMKIRLKIENGRFQHMKKINIFVSKI